MQTIVLWDIDNTLLYSGGAGSLGMARAFSDLYGIDDAFGRVEFSGRTDTAIFADAALMHGVAEADLPRFCDAYVPHLESALGEVSGGALMPGVAELLDALALRRDVTMGLGTGNFRRDGELKLRHYGIAHHFPGMRGGFGEDAHARDAVIRIGIERLAHGGRGDARVVIIGDTPHDVTAAAANGAFALGVATGRNTVPELLAAGADVALDDLSDVERALRVICGEGASTR
jgi:phosphoglycolate phosphatase-like HAD superfamily hydrolase